MPQLLTINEIADFLRVDEEFVRALVTQGDLAAYEFAGQYRFTQEQLDTFLEAHLSKNRNREHNALGELNARQEVSEAELSRGVRSAQMTSIAAQRSPMRPRPRAQQTVFVPQIFRAGLLVPGDVLVVRQWDDKPATVKDESTVVFGGTPMTYLTWAKMVTGWQAVNVYDWIVRKRDGKRLSELRREVEELNGTGRVPA